MKERDEIEDLFSSAFGDFEKMPPVDVKTAIDDQLFNVPPKRRKKGYIWIMSVMALLIGAVWFGYSYFENGSGKEQQVSASSAVSDSGTDGNSEGKKQSRLEKSQILNEVSADIQNGKNNSQVLKNQKTQEKEGFAKKKSSMTNDNEAVQTNGTKNTGGAKKNGGSKKKVSKQPETAELSETIIEEPFNTPGVTEINHPKNDVSDEVENKETELTKNNDEAKTVSAPGDSSQTQTSNEPTPEMPSASQNEEKNWSLSLTAGPTYGLSKLDRPSSPEYFMKENVGFAASVESSFMLGQKWGLTTGLDFNTRTDIFYREVMDSIFIGQAYDYIYDTQVVDSVIDSVLVDVYENSEIVSEEQQRISHFSIAVPVYFTLSFPLTQKLNMELNGGMRFSYVSNKLSSNDFSLPVPTFKSVGIRATLRPQIIYRMDNGMGIGGYLNAGYDVIPAVEWESIKRSRLDLGGGILLRYSF